MEWIIDSSQSVEILNAKMKRLEPCRFSFVGEIKVDSILSIKWIMLSVESWHPSYTARTTTLEIYGEQQQQPFYRHWSLPQN